MTIETLITDIHREVLYNVAADRLSYRFTTDDGAEATPSSAKITIVNSSGSTVLAQTSMTVTAALCTYDLATTTVATWALGENYRADLVIVSGTRTYYRQFFFDIVRRRLESLLSDDHFPPDLKPAYGETNFSRHIQIAFARMNRDIRRHVREQWDAEDSAQERRRRTRPALLLDSENFVDAHLAAATSQAYFENSKDPNDIWWAKHLAAEQRYSAALTAALGACDYDLDDDNLVAADEAAYTVAPRFAR